MLSSYSATSNITMLILPEMAFTGYEFATKSDVAILAENPNDHSSSSLTFTWCQHQAKRLKCLVVCGYPEVDNQNPKTFYNSVMVIGPDGKLQVNIRKTFLYSSDKIWATPGWKMLFYLLEYPSDLDAAVTR